MREANGGVSGEGKRPTIGSGLSSSLRLSGQCLLCPAEVAEWSEGEVERPKVSQAGYAQLVRSQTECFSCLDRLLQPAVDSDEGNAMGEPDDKQVTVLRSLRYVLHAVQLPLGPCPLPPGHKRETTGVQEIPERVRTRPPLLPGGQVIRNPMPVLLISRQAPDEHKMGSPKYRLVVV